MTFATLTVLLSFVLLVTMQSLRFRIRKFLIVLLIVTDSRWAILWDLGNGSLDFVVFSHHHEFESWSWELLLVVQFRAETRLLFLWDPRVERSEHEMMITDILFFLNHFFHLYRNLPHLIINEYFDPQQSVSESDPISHIFCHHLVDIFIEAIHTFKENFELMREVLGCELGTNKQHFFIVIDLQTYSHCFIGVRCYKSVGMDLQTYNWIIVHVNSRIWL